MCPTQDLTSINQAAFSDRSTVCNYGRRTLCSKCNLCAATLALVGSLRACSQAASEAAREMQAEASVFHCVGRLEEGKAD